jgi:hypothetical protein
MVGIGIAELLTLALIGGVLGVVAVLLYRLIFKR